MAPLTLGSGARLFENVPPLDLEQSAASANYVRSMWASIGVIVMGRRLFDLTNGWEGDPPTGEHLVVVSHRQKPGDGTPRRPITSSTIPRPPSTTPWELASGRTISVNAGVLGAQILEADLVDEVAMDVVPVVFGRGRRFFGGISGQHLLEDPHVVIQGERVLRP